MTADLQQFLDGVPDALLDAALAGRGDGVKVALIDSGVDVAHPGLTVRPARSVEVRVGPQGAVVVDGPGADVAGHGTACADVIGRLAPGCTLWNVRALGPDCKGSPAALLAALRWALEHGADIVNLSLGTRDAHLAEPLRELIDLAYRRSILMVAAASNIPGARAYPAAFASLVCVDAGYFASAEDFVFRVGGEAEVEAPGVYVDAAWPGGGRKLVTGTSFATPHVTGHLARVRSVSPGLTPFQIKTVLCALGRRNAARLAAAAAATDAAAGGAS
ncbi:MAG: S8 family serine peptidase [Kofleriaceae bacterium]|nr:S8 family serine peptidase [Kofleriaceae bacterium]